MPRRAPAPAPTRNPAGRRPRDPAVRGQRLPTLPTVPTLAGRGVLAELPRCVGSGDEVTARRVGAKRGDDACCISWSGAASAGASGRRWAPIVPPAASAVWPRRRPIFLPINARPIIVAARKKGNERTSKVSTQSRVMVNSPCVGRKWADRSQAARHERPPANPGHPWRQLMAERRGRPSKPVRSAELPGDWRWSPPGR